MKVTHLLIICPDDKNSQLVQETGQLAMALHSSGIKISILGSSLNGSPFVALINAANVKSPKSKTKILLRQNSPNRMPWSNPQFQAAKRILEEDSSIDAVHLMDISPTSASIADICYEWEVPIIGHIRNTTNLNWQKLPFWKKSKYKKQLKIFNPIIVSANHLLEAVQAQGLQNTAYIPEGIQTACFKPLVGKRPIRRKLRIPEKPTVVCCMASIRPENKQIEAFKLCQPLSEKLHLMFIGEIEDKNYFHSLNRTIKKHKMEAYVTFRKTTDCPEEYLKSSDLFMLIGGIEFYRCTILQALSSGLPVILGQSDSSLTLTNSNKNGIIIDSQDKTSRKELEKLLTEPAYRQTKAVHSHNFIKKDYGLENMVEAYLRLYSRPLS